MSGILDPVGNKDEMRAADSDRQVVADKLKQAMDEGRLDLGEYDERLRKAYEAKTYGDLKALLGDLPGITLSPTESTAVSRLDTPVPARTARAGQVVRAWLGGFGGIFVVCTVIWLVSSVGAGHVGYFWPVWLLVPMAFGLLGRLGGRR